MSDLREKVMDILCDVRVGDPFYLETETDRILALVERSAVERERKAFVAGWRAGQYETENGERYDGNFEPEDELDRRYPLPKEE